MALAFALQTWGTSTGKGDIRAAIELTRLISDIEEDFRNDCYWMMMFRKDCPIDLQNICVQNLREKFKADGYICRNYGTGWPYGPNMMWSSTMSEAQGQFNDHRKNPKAGRFPYTGILTMEPDCIPMRKDWIKAITDEWNSRVIMAGEWTEDDEDPEKGQVVGWPKYEALGHKESDHLNGNMVIRPDFPARYRPLFSASASWDMCMAPTFMRLGLDSNLFLQHYRRLTINRQEIPHITKNDVVPALFHGVQDKAGKAATDQVGKLARKFMREILVEGRPVEA